MIHLALMALALLRPCVGFPKVASIITSRSVAIQKRHEWNIIRKDLGDAEEETVLHVLVHSPNDVAQLDHLQTMGVLSFRELEEAESARFLEGINDDYSCYRTVVETYDSMNQLVRQYPELISVESIGPSYRRQQNENDGHDIKVLVIGATASTQGNKANMMLVGGQHSRELPPPEVLMRWTEHLLENYGVDPDITWILNRTNIHIVPIVNPDGREIVQDNLDWYYRKNARPNDCDEGPQSYGVDLNRNYPMWYGDDDGSSSDQCDNDYRGTGPLSEPESSAVFQYANTLFEDQWKKGSAEEAMAREYQACPTQAAGIFLDLHSNGDMIFFPWAHENKVSPNHLSLLTMAAKLAKPGNYVLWGPEQEGFLYDTSGDTSDSMYGINCIFAGGYEIGSIQYATCNELENRIVPVVQESLLYAAKCVGAPYLLPLGPDILTIDVDSTDSKQVTMIVEVSDGALIVDHANYPNGADRSQPIAEVRVFVDSHPYDGASDGYKLEPVDGDFDDVDEMATLSLDLSEMEGIHILYFQAKDVDGNVGPASAVYIALDATTPTDIAEEDIAINSGGGGDAAQKPGSSSEVNIDLRQAEPNASSPNQSTVPSAASGPSRLAMVCVVGFLASLFGG